MNVGEYRVALVREADPLSEGVEIHVFLNTGSVIKSLGPDGQWHESGEGAARREPALRLPYGAFTRLIDEVDLYRGAPSHARTEAAVLREWLATERARTDRLIDLAIQAPRIMDLGHGITLPTQSSLVKP